MAAVFYTLAPNVKFFQDSVPAITSVSIPFLRNLAGVNDSVITEFAVRNTETIQFFLTFDDAISYFYYGKGLGEVNIGGLLFTDANGKLNGLQNYHDMIGRNRGKEIQISVGWMGLTCVLNGYNLDIVPDELLGKFQLSLTVINHTLRQNRMKAVC